MSSNNGTTSSSDDSTNQAVLYNLTVAAFIISLVALVLSILQALLAYLQFDDSEIGRRRCQSEAIMGTGGWATKTKRKFKWNEFRYQVYFQVPVFYTAPPGYVLAALCTSPGVLVANAQLESQSGLCSRILRIAGSGSSGP